MESKAGIFERGSSKILHAKKVQWLEFFRHQKRVQLLTRGCMSSESSYPSASQ